MSGAGTGWAEVTVALPTGANPSAVEATCAFLFDLGAPGLEEQDSRLLAYFPDDAALPDRVAATARHAARLLGSEAAVTSRPLPPVDWAEAWKREVKATEVAPGIVVAPTWDPYAGRPDEVVIRLDPGMAFGTGTHPSTRLCLQALAELRPEGEILDLGTGSGILAIAAAKLGARRVLALDVDPVATDVARANVVQNGVGAVVRVATGDLSAAPGPFDLVLANILAAPLIATAPALAGRLAPSGAAVLSGLLADEAAGVAAAYEAEGLTRVALLEEAEWAALVLTRPGG